MEKVFSDIFAARKAAANFELTTRLDKGFEVTTTGKQVATSEWNSDKGKSDYKLSDQYDLGVDLSGNDGARIGRVKVELPGLTVELGIGWFSAETDYGWKHYVEYDSPKTWRKKTIGDE